MVGSNHSKKQPNPDHQEAQEFIDSQTRLDTNVKFNLENLVKIDEKLQQLIDLIKGGKTNNIS